MFRDRLDLYLKAFKNQYQPNLTAISTATVNASAGLKSAPRKRKRANSPDTICQTTTA